MNIESKMSKHAREERQRERMQKRLVRQAERRLRKLARREEHAGGPNA